MAAMRNMARKHGANELHTKSHSAILGKGEFEPIGNVDTFVEGKTRFNLKLNNLIDNDDEENYQVWL